MSKEIGINLKNHLAEDVTTIATCLKLTRQDNTEYFFTNHDADITYDGDTYEATDGILPTALVQNDNMATDNMDVIAELGSDKINEADVAAGLFDYAEVDIFIVNYMDLTMGVMYLAKGWSIGAIEIRDGVFQAELRGHTQRLQQDVCEIYTPECRADLGDSRCGIDLDDSAGDNWYSGIVTYVPSVTPRTIFQDNNIPSTFGANAFTYGKVTWLTPSSGDSYTGNNAGFSREVKAFVYATGMFQLFEAVPYNIEVGDEFIVTLGCDKNIETCRDKFNNVKNFRGEPFIPGWDQIMDIIIR